LSRFAAVNPYFFVGDAEGRLRDERMVVFGSIQKSLDDLIDGQKRLLGDIASLEKTETTGMAKILEELVFLRFVGFVILLILPFAVPDFRDFAGKLLSLIPK